MAEFIVDNGKVNLFKKVTTTLSSISKRGEEAVKDDINVVAGQDKFRRLETTANSLLEQFKSVIPEDAHKGASEAFVYKPKSMEDLEQYKQTERNTFEDNFLSDREKETRKSEQARIEQMRVEGEKNKQAKRDKDQEKAQKVADELIKSGEEEPHKTQKGPKETIAQMKGRKARKDAEVMTNEKYAELQANTQVGRLKTQEELDEDAEIAKGEGGAAGESNYMGVQSPMAGLRIKLKAGKGLMNIEDKGQLAEALLEGDDTTLNSMMEYFGLNVKKLKKMGDLIKKENLEGDETHQSIAEELIEQMIDDQKVGEDQKNSYGEREAFGGGQYKDMKLKGMSSFGNKGSYNYLSARRPLPSPDNQYNDQVAILYDEKTGERVLRRPTQTLGEGQTPENKRFSAGTMGTGGTESSMGSQVNTDSYFHQMKGGFSRRQGDYDRNFKGTTVLANYLNPSLVRSTPSQSEIGAPIFRDNILRTADEQLGRTEFGNRQTSLAGFQQQLNSAGMGNYSMVRTRPDNSLFPKSPKLSRKTSVFAEPASEDEINIQRPRMGKTYEGGAKPPRRFILGKLRATYQKYM